ncbi:transketolase family protein [Sulfurisphaera ohwakuensis]|uniref:2-oxoacid oxidoreductase (ferredoxin) n=1 Tax=Sulfurisphaera ohwakuensis TaxID=69656 RepID=A0A650CJ96_SULOH|nr:transketolase family protein [Sulfurisphaera ohwakuensis]MBB5254020.1 transketolase [Sulfurisphaera ohwakuensis]QGR17900.1 transketolase family protein [Sulfurisphaera ohwakuensis]
MMQRSTLPMRDTFGRLLAELGEKNKDMIVITADVGNSTRAMYFREKFPDRYFNVGISEQDMVNFAAGLSVTGFKPIVVGFAMFVMRAWEQIRNSIARMNLDVKIMVTHSGYSDSGDGSSHQALEDIALMRVLPNMKVIIPADSEDVKRSLPVVVNELRGPLYYRMGRDYTPVITEGLDYDFKLGKAYVLRDGEDLAIMGAGVVLADALKAAEELEKMGISAAVINLMSIKPIDEDLIEYYARKTGRIITIEEHSIYGGIGSAVAEVVVKKYPVPMRFIGAITFGRSARSERDLLDFYGINYKSILNAAMELVK